MSKLNRKNISKLGEQERFELCLKEAYELCDDIFMPELDSLTENNVDSILYRVLIEQDLLEEGEPYFQGATEEEKRDWSNRVNAFVNHWKQYA